MSYRKVLVLVGFMLPLLLAWFMGAMVQEEEIVAAAGLHLAGAAYSVRGPHPVGTRKMLIDGDSPLEITAWYPAAKPDDYESTITYPYVIKMFAPVGELTIATFEGQATRDAPYDLSTGPFPLVILSPGFAIGSTTYAWLAEHLASYGFVVISPEHDEQLDPSLLWQSTIVRPQDILTVLSFIDEQVGTGGAFEGLINSSLVAVIGHSYGGYTSLVAGGARLNTAGFGAVCQTAYETNDPVVFLCDALLPHMTDMAELAGLGSIPQNLWPDWSDPRVKAAVSLAGDAVVFDQAGLAEITIPVMAIGGTSDRDSPYMWGTYPSFEYASSPKKVRIGLVDTAHMVFTGPCEAVRRFVKAMPNEFCSDPTWGRKQAHDLIKHFTTAFLLAELMQDADAAAALAPEAVEFPGVTYEVQGY